MNKDIYGFVNGTPVYSNDEFRYKSRGFGPITCDDDLMAYAEKVTYGWSNAGHKHSFTSFYLSDYALSEPYASLTHAEFDRLCELQRKARAEYEAKEAARCWQKVGTTYWADNSIEEKWRDKDGALKIVTVCQPHGDACY